MRIDSFRIGFIIKRNKLLALSMFLFSLFEYYYFGIRIFDFLALLVVIPFLLSFNVNRNVFIISKKIVYIALIFIFLWSLAFLNNLFNFFKLNANTNDDIKTIIGYSLCIFVFLFFLLLKFKEEDILPIINALLLFHTFFFFLQFIFYYLTGGLLNYIPNSEPRLMSAIFRPAGLFLEPGHYCLIIFLFLSLKFFCEKKVDKIFLFSLITLLLSLSLWGIISFLFFIFILITKRSNTAILIYSILISSVIFFLGYYVYNHNDLFKTIIDFAFFDRFDRIRDSKDGSTETRSGLPISIENFGYESLFGYGFTNQLKSGGATLLTLILNNFGIIGAVIFYSVFLTVSARGKLMYVMSVIFLSSSATHAIMSTFLFWAWLAIFIRLNIAGTELKFSDDSSIM